MLLRRRALYRALYSDNAILPRAYQQVEWLESHGKEYILTGYNPSNYTMNSYKWQVDGQVISIIGSAWNGFVGVFNTSTIKYTMLGWESSLGSNVMRTQWGAGTTETDVTWDLSQRTVYLMDFLNGTFYFNGVAKSSPTRSTVAIGCTDLALFGIQQNQTMKYFSNSRIFNFKIWDNSTLIHNFYPCYQKNGIVPGMYDMLTNTFHPNSGSGAFTYGPKYIGEL